MWTKGHFQKARFKGRQNELPITDIELCVQRIIWVTARNQRFEDSSVILGLSLKIQFYSDILVFGRVINKKHHVDVVTKLIRRLHINKHKNRKTLKVLDFNGLVQYKLIAPIVVPYLFWNIHLYLEIHTSF